MNDFLLSPKNAPDDAEHAELLRQRLHLVVGVGLGAMAIAMLFEFWVHPERSSLTTTALAIEFLSGALALLGCRQSQLRERPRELGLGFVVMFAWTIAWHLAASGRPLGLLASSYVILLTSLVVFLPWGWRPQAVATIAAAFGFAVTWWASDPRPVGEDLFHLVLVLGAAGAQQQQRQR